MNVCRQKYDIDRRRMNFSKVPANFFSIYQVVLELQQKFDRLHWKCR